MDFSGIFWKPTSLNLENPTETSFQTFFKNGLTMFGDTVELDFSKTIHLKPEPLSGKFLVFSKQASKGHWEGFRLTLDIPRQSFLGFPDFSFFGAVLGNSLFYFLSEIERGTIFPNFSSLAALWLNRTTFVGPSYYEITNLLISIIDQNPQLTRTASISNSDGYSLRHLTQVEDWLGALALNPDMDRDTYRRLILALFFARFYQRLELNSNQDSERPAQESDEAITYDLIRPRDTTQVIRLAFYFSHYFPRQEIPSNSAQIWDNSENSWNNFQLAAQTLGFPARNNTTTPTGCGDKQNQIFRLFSKSAKIRRKLLYCPRGLIAGKNCVLECYEWYLQKNQEFFKEFPADQIWTHPSICSLLSLEDSIDLSSYVVKETLNRITKVNVLCFKDELHTDGRRRITQFPWPINPDAPDGLAPLRLLVYSQGNDLFGFEIWHSCIVEDFSMLKEKCLCNSCGEWFSRESPHFGNCAICESCGKHFTKSGNHYVSCKGKQLVAAKAKENGKIAPSAINHYKNQIYKNVWFADFECFQDKKGNHVPYLAVLKSISQKNSVIFWGKNCLKEFITYITTPTNGVKGYLYCHNGSGYDFNIILVGLLQYSEAFKTKPINVLMRGTKILTCQISTKPNLILRDTYLLIPSSLAKICKDLKIKQEFAKTHFDHSKIFSFESAEKHKEEVVKYCIQDVVALNQIFVMFAEAMWNIAPVLMQTSMSLASHALEMWKILEKGPVLNSLALPDYPTYLVLREMYHGGRVLATLPKYDSALYHYITEEDENGNLTFFDENGNTLMDFDEIVSNSRAIFNREEKEFLKQVDVVSLYPHCMYEQKFPVGAFIPPVEFSKEDGITLARDIQSTIRASKWAEVEFNGIVEKVEHTHYTILKEEMFRHCYKVTMNCPQDILVAFLMRKEQGNPIQNLHPLVNHWVTGVELFEAIKIGYDLKEVHCRFGWESRSPIFKNYIGTLFKIKEQYKNDKSNIMYLCSKLLMNALSGKFGQKIVSKVTKLFTDLPDDPDKTFEGLLNISNQLIEAMDGGEEPMPVGYIFTGEKAVTDLETSLPTHLSVFILAHSRRKMSKMLRYVNGYKDKNRTLMYTDTDSMVVTESTFLKLVEGGFVGSKLGQLEDEFPKQLIVAARFLAPKVYCLMMLAKVPDSSKAAICYKIRCKGIPHRGDVFFANSYELDNREFKVRLEEFSNSTSESVKDLGKRFYVIRQKSDDSIVMIHPFLNVFICDLLLSEKFYLQVHFGSILKNTKVKFQLISKWISRSLGVNSWWNNPKCPRVLMDAEGYEFTTCKGSLLTE